VTGSAAEPARISSLAINGLRICEVSGANFEAVGCELSGSRLSEQ
jgi:hypothetical protein